MDSCDLNALLTGVGGIVWEADLLLNRVGDAAAVRQLLGRDTEECSLNYFLSQLEDASQLRNCMEALIKEEHAGVQPIEFCLRGSNNQPRWLTSWLQPGPREGSIAIISFDTTQKHVREEINHYQDKLRTLGRLTGGLAHDFNNFIGGIIAASELLELEITDCNDKTRRRVSSILTAAQRAANLSRGLLTFSRAIRPRQRVFDVKELMTTVANLVRLHIDSPDVVTLILPDEPIWVSGEPSALSSSLLHLAMRGRDGGRGSQALQLTVVSASRFPKRLRSHAQRVVLSVCDSGCGLSVEELTRAQAGLSCAGQNVSGDDLELATMQSVVSGLNGDIFGWSVPEVGSCVSIVLPCEPTSTSGEVAHQDECGEKVLAQSSGSSMILVVDDEENIRETSRSFLEMHGFRVLTAADGIEGWDVFLAHEHNIAAIILDVQMPRRSGLELLRDIRMRRPECPVVVISAFWGHTVPPADARTTWLSKPIRLKDLHNEVKQVLQQTSS